MKFIIFVAISACLHIFLLFSLPEFKPKQKKDVRVELISVAKPAPVIVEESPITETPHDVTAGQEQEEKVDASAMKKKSDIDAVEKPEPKEPDPVKEDIEQTSRQDVVPVKPIIKKDTPTPVKKKEPEVTAAKIKKDDIKKPQHKPDNKTVSQAKKTDKPTPAKTEKINKKADITIVQEFVGDRIKGQIEFKGKGRVLAFTPKAPDFKLTGNTTLKIKFKIDQEGRTYDIQIPPITLEVERSLFLFVEKMRFIAVLYNEPDSAVMKIELKVR